MDRFASQDFPKGEEVFGGGKEAHIQEGDVPANLLGSPAFRLNGCMAQRDGVCLARVPDETLRVVGQLTSCLNALADRLTKSVVFLAETLLLLESTEGGTIRRAFYLLVFASYNPKFQLLAACRYADRNQQPDGCAVLGFPFELDVDFEPCRTTGAGETIACKTSSQLSLALARMASDWSCAQLSYTVPDDGTLTTCLVDGMNGDSKPIGGKNAPKATRMPKPAEEPMARLLRNMLGRDPVEAGRQAGRDRQFEGGGEPPIEAIAEAYEAPQHVDPEAYEDDDGICEDPGLLEELLESHIDEIGGAEVDQPMQPADDDQDGVAPFEAVAEATTPEAPPRPWADISDPDVGGYFWRPGPERPMKVGRLTAAFSNSRGIRCYQHSNCTRAVGIPKVPSFELIRQWLHLAEPKQHGDTKAIAEAKRNRHLDQLRILRDTGALPA